MRQRLTEQLLLILVLAESLWDLFAVRTLPVQQWFVVLTIKTSPNILFVLSK